MDSIKLGPKDKIFASGVSYGSKVAEQIATEIGGSDVSHEERMGFFWLAVGMGLATEFPDATEDEKQLYIQGASLRKPENTTAVSVVIPSIGNAAFGDLEEDEDDSQARAEIARLLRVAADAVEEGCDDLRLHDVNGHTVGQLTLRLDV